MSNFEKEYQSLRLEIGDYDRLLGHGDVIDKFKDWQPPKEIFKIPKLVSDFIDHKRLIDIAKSSVPVKIIDWLNEQTGHADFDICVSHLIKIKAIGYTVDKEQLYYLCEKNTGYYLNKKGDSLNLVANHLVANPYFDDNNKFTQSEIDELNIGSYEQIPVKVED